MEFDVARADESVVKAVNLLVSHVRLRADRIFDPGVDAFWDQLGIKGAELLQFTRLGAIMISTVSLSQIASEDPEANDPPPASTQRPLVIGRSHPMWAEINAEQEEKQ